MSEIFVQFSGADAQEVVASFGCMQDSATYPNQAKVAVDDPRWLEYCDSLPESIRESLVLTSKPVRRKKGSSKV